MKITQLKQQVKNPERVSVFVEGKYSFSLTLDQLLQEKLKKDTVLDAERVKQLVRLSEEGKIRARALEWVMGRPHSERELRDYLFKKKVEKDFADKLVEEFQDKKYLNDEQFARWFAGLRMRKNKSARAITAELRGKGVSPITIQSVVTELGHSSLQEKEAIRKLINKLSKRSRYSDSKKLASNLVSKGFSYQDVKEVMNEETDRIEED